MSLCLWIVGAAGATEGRSLRSRGSVLFAAVVLAGIAFTSTVSPSRADTTSANSAQISQLLSQRAALVAQLSALLPGKQSAAADLASAESVFGGAQHQLDIAQAALDKTNAELQAIASQTAADQTVINSAKVELGKAARGAYENNSSNAVVSHVLGSKNLNAAMQQLDGANTVDTQLTNLQKTLADREADLHNQQEKLSLDNAAAQSEANALAGKRNQFLAVVANRDIAFQSANAPVRAIEAQIANIDNEIAALESPGGTVNGGSPCGNRFAFGQCTWYVATRRCIPWIGNADQWYYNAAAMGFQEGHQPEVGAVVVFWPGGDGASSVGHVGYVEVVGPASGVPAGEFKLSEMNYAGWDRVSYRVLPNNSSGIQGFIYGR